MRQNPKPTYSVIKMQNEFVVENGRKVILREPRIEDVKQLMNFINSLVEEEAPILVNKKSGQEEERKYLEDVLSKIKDRKLYYLVAELDGEIIGSSQVEKGKFRSSHVANYGISVKNGYRGLGIGKALSKNILDLARDDSEIEIVSLEVYDSNHVARSLYESLGFKQVACLPRRIKFKDKNVDALIMDLVLK